MINIKNNTCPICINDNLNWNLNYGKSDIELFRCGHGICKSCYKKLQKPFKCCLCRDEGQLHTVSINHETNKWNTFNEWYEEYEMFIKAGCANNIINSSSYGKQLKRLYKQSKKCK